MKSMHGQINLVGGTINPRFFPLSMQYGHSFYAGIPDDLKFALL